MASRALNIIKAQVKFIIVIFVALFALVLGGFVLIATAIFAPLIAWLSKGNVRSYSFKRYRYEQKPNNPPPRDFIDVDFEVVEEDKNKNKKD